ncbi:MAG: transcriptional regulator [Microvirga sp.]
MPLETVPFDAARYFTSEDDQAGLLADALKTGEAGYIAAARGTIARARGMTKVAPDAGGASASPSPSVDSALSLWLGGMRSR